MMNTSVRLLGSTLTLAILLAPLALPSAATYKRPSNARPPNTATSTSGARQGSAIAPGGLPLTLLAPQQHVGQSRATHPTFEWFVPVEYSLRGEFQLYEVIGADEIAENGEPQSEFQDEFRRVLETPHEFESQQGFMSFTLPEELAGLKPNTSYIWQVLLRYGPRSSNIVKVRSQIEIVEGTSPALQTTRPQPIETLPPGDATQTSNAAQIEQLSELGLWYDALALTTQLLPGEANEQRRELFLSLARLEATGLEATGLENGESLSTNSNEISLGEIAPDEISSDEISHSEALRQIAEWQEAETLAQLKRTRP